MGHEPGVFWLSKVLKLSLRRLWPSCCSFWGLSYFEGEKQHSRDWNPGSRTRAPALHFLHPAPPVVGTSGQVRCFLCSPAVSPLREA